MLKIEIPRYYKVKQGQTVREIAEAFAMPPSLIVKENSLLQEAEEGQILLIPRDRGNLYTVKIGESKTLLCGSAENYERKNGTSVFYPYQKIFL